MGRINRRSILCDGCYAHVFSRASEKKRIFQGGEDFQKFKNLLMESKQRYAYRIHHYCLMHTHFHLLVSLESLKLFSEGLKWVKWQYARHYNLSKKRFGPLWRDRFRSRVIEDERYLQACGRYVEGNPVEAGMVKRCEDWPHSSSRYYFSGSSDGLVDPYHFDGEALVIKGDVKKYFEKGNVIGSDLFKIQLKEGMFHAMPVS